MYKHVIFCGPRGAGKGTLVYAMAAEFPELRRIVSHTTREPRPGEVNGDSYYYTTIEDFDRMRRCGEIVGWKRITASQRSGVSKAELLKHRYGVTDLTPEIASLARIAIAEYDGTALVVGVDAPAEQRLRRIRAREPSLTLADVEHLMAVDPVPSLGLYSDLDLIVRNDKDGDPEPAIRQTAKAVRRFLNGSMA